MTAEVLFSYVLLGTLGIFSLLMALLILRSIKGPGTTNRVIAINMLGTIVICSIAILSLLLEEDYLLDVCLIYAMISFLAVVVLTKIMAGNKLEKEHIEDEREAIRYNLTHQDKDGKGDQYNGLL